MQGEITGIARAVPSFPSRYSGASSYPSRGVGAATETAVLYLDARPSLNLEVYVNPELAIEAASGSGLELGVCERRLSRSAGEPF